MTSQASAFADHNASAATLPGSNQALTPAIQRPSTLIPIRPISGRPGPHARKPQSAVQDRRGTDEVGSLGFFAVDHRAWRRACEIGLNAAICYLALARGTQADNRTTWWSINAIEHRTGISRKRLKAPIQALEDAGLVRLMNNIPTRPRRFLVPAHEIGPGMGSLPPMSEAEAEVWQALPIRTVPKLDDDVLAIIRSLRQKRYVRQRGSVFEARPELALSCDPKPEWVWLPNAIIDGVDGKTPAIELIRQTQDIGTLRLFIDLYHVQSLSFDGGIPTDLLRKTYSRKKVAFDGALVAWSFEHASHETSISSPFYRAFLADSPADGNQHFWDALSTLERLGVATFVEHLFDGPGGEAEIIHPMAKPLPGRDITEAEGELYEAASAAARKLYAAHNALPSEQEMVLVPEHIAKVELRGVLRLRHRPHTSVTAEWMAQSERWREYTAYFRDVFLPTSKSAA